MGTPARQSVYVCVCVEDGEGMFLLQELKKSFNCNGSIVEDKELGTIVQLQGDQRDCAKKFLLEKGLVGKDNLQIHVF